jgi:hypothetical protein
MSLLTFNMGLKEVSILKNTLKFIKSLQFHLNFYGFSN